MIRCVQRLDLLAQRVNLPLICFQRSRIPEIERLMFMLEQLELLEQLQHVWSLIFGCLAHPVHLRRDREDTLFRERTRVPQLLDGATLHGWYPGAIAMCCDRDADVKTNVVPAVNTFERAISFHSVLSRCPLQETGGRNSPHLGLAFPATIRGERWLR